MDPIEMLGRLHWQLTGKQRVPPFTPLLRVLQDMVAAPEAHGWYPTPDVLVGLEPPTRYRTHDELWELTVRPPQDGPMRTILMNEVHALYYTLAERVGPDHPYVARVVVGAGRPAGQPEAAPTKYSVALMDISRRPAREMSTVTWVPDGAIELFISAEAMQGVQLELLPLLGDSRYATPDEKFRAYLALHLPPHMQAAAGFTPPPARS
jgi:hypothetical protein